MAINFPASPSVNDAHYDINSGTSWRWTGVYWQNWVQTVTPESSGVNPMLVGVVGEIKQAILTEVLFQTSAGSDWVLCDGQSCVGSSYETLTGDSTVPDLRGQFLRGLDTTGTVDPDGASRSLGDSQAGEIESHTHTYDDVGSANSTGAAVAGYQAGPYQFKYQLGDESGATGGDETRPKNVAVNFFIKIN